MPREKRLGGVGELARPSKHGLAQPRSSLDALTLVDSPQQVVHQERRQIRGLDPFVHPRVFDALGDTLAYRERTATVL